MKIVIAGAPKTGNMWLKNILGHVYGIPRVDVSNVPDFRTYMDENFPSFVTHQHFLPKPYLLDWGMRRNVCFLTMARHPGDLFVSLYFYVNRFAKSWEETGTLGTTASHRLIGKELGSPAVYSYLEKDFQEECLGKSLAWIKQGYTTCVRYEDLIEQPLLTLKNLTNTLQPVNRWRIWRAIHKSRFKSMRGKASETMVAHFREGKTGGWSKHLNQKHIALISEHCAAAMTYWNYSFDRVPIGPSIES